MFCVLNVVCVINCICVFYFRFNMLDIYPVITYPNNVNGVDQYRACMGCFNNIIKCKQRTCNTTQFIISSYQFLI